MDTANHLITKLGLPTLPDSFDTVHRYTTRSQSQRTHKDHQIPICLFLAPPHL